MKRKLISLLLVVIMALTLSLGLTSCGGGDDGKLHITFYHTMGENLRTVLDTYIAEFEALYPEYKIDHEQVGGYDDVREQIATEITVGNQPNIAYCYPDHVALYNLALAVKTLDGYIDSEEVITRADGTTEILGLTPEQKEDFIQGYYEEGRQFGDADGDGVNEMYTIPLSKSTEVLYYNKTYFDECKAIYENEFILKADGTPETDKDGNPVKNPNYQNEIYNLFVPTTWDEMELICSRILAVENAKLSEEDKQAGKTAQVIPLGYDSEANWFITMCEQLGSPYTSLEEGNHFLFDNETNRNFVAKFRDWYLKGYVTTQEIHGSYTSSLFTAKTGTKSYMSIGSSAGATHQRPTKDAATGDYPFEVGIASIPQYNSEAPKVISQGPSLCIFEGSEAEMRASWLFVKFLATNRSFQADFSIASGYVPVIKSVDQDELYSQFLNNADGKENIAALSVKVCLEQESAYYTSPAFNGSSTARDEVGALLQECLLIGKDVADVPAAIKKAFEDAIAECKYQAE